MKVEDVKFSKEMKDRYPDTCGLSSYIDMQLRGKDGDLYICGNNDWGYLLAEPMSELYLLGEKVDKEISDGIFRADVYPAAIGLGRNEYRWYKIYRMIKGIKTKNIVYSSIPVIELDVDNGIKMLKECGDNDTILF